MFVVDVDVESKSQRRAHILFKLCVKYWTKRFCYQRHVYEAPLLLHYNRIFSTKKFHFAGDNDCVARWQWLDGEFASKLWEFTQKEFGSMVDGCLAFHFIDWSWKVVPETQNIRRRKNKFFRPEFEVQRNDRKSFVLTSHVVTRCRPFWYISHHIVKSIKPIVLVLFVAHHQHHASQSARVVRCSMH